MQPIKFLFRLFVEIIDMKKTAIYLFLLALLSVATPGLTQDKNEELIDWSSSRRLTWADYKAEPDKSSDAAAITTSYLGIQYNFSDGKITFNIVCKFSKNKSWGLYKNAHILEHEQGHFDITEIFARKLNKETSEYKFDKKSYQKDLQKIYDDVMKAKEKLQTQYDSETDFSRNKDKQAEWLVKIAKMLADTEAYANYK